MEWWMLALAVLLYFVSAVLLFAEIFIPSGGLISLFAVICIIAATSILFNQSVILGIIGVIFALIMIPTVIISALKLLPKTRFGKAVFLKPSDRTIGDAIPDTDDLLAMLNSPGKVISPLRPVGMVDFNGKRIECVAETGYVDKDASVIVIKVEGTQLTVRVNE